MKRDPYSLGEYCVILVCLIAVVLFATGVLQ